MTIEPHHATAQLASITLKLRDDLSVSVRQIGDKPVYVIEDDLNSRFYQVGLAEYTFLSLLDGHTTFADAFGRTATIMKQQALSEAEAAKLCRWLVETGLAKTPDSDDSSRLHEAAQRIRERQWSQNIHPVFLRIPLLNPDPILRPMVKYLGWIFSIPVAFLWLIIVISGVMCVVIRWNDAATMSFTVISQNNWLWLAMTWFLLKLVHEAAHGITARHYRIPVREMGILMILFIPLPYVDVTTSWRLESRLRRIIISAAGIGAELMVAGLAAIVWFQTEPGLLRQHAFNVMFTASVLTLLFNANPLMRFDGYYILTDLLNLPNLSVHGQLAIRSICRRWFLGLPAIPPRWPEKHTSIVYLYGVAAFVWRIVICAGLILAAESLYYGAGILLALLAIGLWVLLPLARLIRFLIWGSKTEHPDRRRFGLVIVMIAIGFTMIWQLPWYPRVEAPVIIDYHPIVTVRAGVSGFVRKVHVGSGETIQTGAPLITLHNPELNAQLQIARNQVRQSEQQSLIFFQKGEIAAWESALENSRALQNRLNQLNEQASRLQIVALEEGTILDSEPRSLLGTYVSAGQPVISIGNNRNKHLLAMVDETDINRYTDHVGCAVTFHITGMVGKFGTGKLGQLEPRATNKILHPALTSIAGGPLDVRTISSPTNSNATDLDTRYEYATPHFLTRIEVDRAVLSDYVAGQSGKLRLSANRGTVGQLLKRTLIRWWQNYRSFAQRYYHLDR